MITIKELTPEKIEYVYNTHMVNDFPPSELKPLKHILDYTKGNIGKTIGLYKDDNLIGYASFVLPKNSNYALLDYLAIIKDVRNQGYGHIFFKHLNAFFKDNRPDIQAFFIESENPDATSDDAQKTIRSKRIDFYKSCGCSLTTFNSTLFGVTYSILLYRLNAEKECFYNIDDVDFIYKSMFKPHHYESMVKLWDCCR